MCDLQCCAHFCGHDACAFDTTDESNYPVKCRLLKAHQEYEIGEADPQQKGTLVLLEDRKLLMAIAVGQQYFRALLMHVPTSSLHSVPLVATGDRCNPVCSPPV
jgi:hypothetical protein